MATTTRNREHNINNRYQGDTPRVLCVCSAGLLRSPTAARVLAGEFDLNTRAVGATAEYALIPMDECLVAWSDEIVIMDKECSLSCAGLIDECKGWSGTITVLNIPDNYGYMDKELVRKLVEEYYKWGKYASRQPLYTGVGITI